MLSAIRRKFSELKSSTSGNATLLVALGMPVLIGASGLAVDTAQWYMWKREIQYAADQAALAGAWARSDDDSRSVYVTRARQEFTANVSKTSTIDTTPNVSLANYNGGSQNSVVVTVSARKTLPFSNFLTGRTTTVSVYSQASFSEGSSYTACLIAVDQDDSGAITIGGNAVLNAQCGIAALSNSPTSITINGNPTVDPGWVVSAGGIDDWLDTHTDADIHEYMSGLTDPFAALTTPTPNPNPAQTYACVPGTTSTVGDKRTRSDTIYTYWRGSNTNNATQLTTYTGTGYLPNVTGSWGTWSYQVTLPTNSVNGTTFSDGAPLYTQVSGSGSNKVYRMAVTRVYSEYANTVTTTTQTQASLSQGTYSGGFDVSCRTVLNPGIYVIDGGRLKITGQYQVTASGVLFILKNGAYIDFTGGSNVTLTAATAAQLTQVGGLSTSQAQQFAGMLIYEDRASRGTNNRNTINGNSDTILNGKIYLPKSDIRFNGTAGVTSACLLIAAANITLEGNTNMSSFCPDGMTNTDEVSHGNATVKLVA
ncbi:MAG: pilus assembly protein TadG-related protein [Novosphingobium sp.]